jgi:hypothetical protein
MIISQETGTTVFEKLQQLQSTGSSNSKNYGLDKKKDSSDKVTVNQSLVCCICSIIANKLYSTLLVHISHGRQLFFYQELWLKDVALSRFADTKDCPPSLVCTMLLLVITSPTTSSVR